MPFTATITTTEIREEWNRIRSGRTTLTDPAIAETVDAIGSSDVRWFYGMSGDDMDHAVNYGVQASKTLTASIGGGEDFQSSEIQWNDEAGFLDLPAAFSGEENFWVRFNETPQPISVKIVAQVNMLADTPAEVLGEYCDFIMTAIDAAANATGGAPALEIVHYVNNAIQRGGECRFHIPLVAAGEQVDRVAWSCYFGKAGFRMLGFLARAVAAQKAGRKLSPGMGASNGPGWRVRRTGDTLTITCPPSASRFPRERMEEELTRALESFGTAE